MRSAQILFKSFFTNSLSLVKVVVAAIPFAVGFPAAAQIRRFNCYIRKNGPEVTCWYNPRPETCHLRFLQFSRCPLLHFDRNHFDQL